MEDACRLAGNAKQLNSSLKMFIKIVISAGLLAWILNRIQLGPLKVLIINSHWPSLFASFLMVNICMLVSVLKWQPLLTVQKVQIPFIRLLSFYYVGPFANNFLPSSIGGDAMRIYDAARSSGKTKEAAASVIVERLLASLALALTAAIALALVSGTGGNGIVSWLVGGILAFCLAVTAILLCSTSKEDSKIGQWLCCLGNYKEHPGVLVKVLMLSFLFQFVLVLSNVFIFRAIGADIPLLKHFLFIPVIMAVSMLPLSINGLGIREGMYVLLYGFAGINPATALAGSLLFFTLVTVTSLAGGVIFALRK
ncbi:MAG: hypothetical protein A4E52_01773 [Pelotomaculum sp. PtaB.Bin013]|nr:MAG: hypothetical protein A4E52_01773 [Pelotomaculum sp. PtaB.Bin013]